MLLSCCPTIHPASRAEMNPLAQPVPSGQKGSSRESPATARSRGKPFLTTALAHCAKNRKEWNDLHKLVAKRKKKARYRGTG